MTARVEPDRDIGLQGHYAGIVTRAAAFGIDVVIASSLFTLGGGVVEYLFTSVLGKDVSLENSRVVAIVVLTLWLLVYFAYPIAVGGRTLGMALVGLEVVTKDGRDLNTSRAVLRTLCLPLSLALLGVGILMILINRQRRALHDLIAGTAVVYSWNARAARLRFLAKPAEGRHPSSSPSS
jgi:uncharacterized RDD family membrane protein YckC